jgi:hypothetical protein
VTLEDRRAQLASQIAEPGPADRADLDRWLDDCRAQSERLDEEHRLLGIGRTAAVCMTHEITGSWASATASRWYLALPERYMTLDSMSRPDWNHSHYPHDEHGHIGRVTTRQRPETEADTRTEQLVAVILADLAEKGGSA